MSGEDGTPKERSVRLIFQQLESIRDVMMDSLTKNYVPFPIDRSLCSAWTDTLRKGGETIIYTSFMYQLSSLFRAYEKHLSTFARMGGSTRLASLGKFLIKPDRDDLRRGYRILSNISALLLKNGIDHGYLYDDEPYSGGLLLELGMLDQFWDYGSRVLKLMKDHGVRSVITVDPHTTNAM
ncbi:MAG: (Fe-S)-binding protein, partial [Thermoplasmataceae archaeon]